MAIAHPKVLRSPIKIYHFGYGKPWEDGVMTNAYYSLWKKYNIKTTHINKHEP